MKWKKLVILLIVPFLLGGILGGCSDKVEESEGLTVITTLFPQYDFTRQIIGDKGTVSLLLPPGTEGHNYEPTPKDIISIYEADAFIYTGEAMEPWAHKVIESIPKASGVAVIDASSGISPKGGGP